MKIAYVAYLVGSRPDGLSDKISTQLHLWAAAGHDATLYLLNRRSPEGDARTLAGELFPFAGGGERLAATRRLYGGVRAARPDLIYLRYDLFLPPPSALATVAPVAVEFNSNARVEWAGRSRAAAVYERQQERLLLARASGAVCVSHELAAALRERRPQLPLRVIANGVGLDDLPVLPAPRGERPRLAYLGDDVPYQGVDKLFELAAARPDWRFDLVGIDAGRSRANVTCHGYLPPDRYEPILACADVAVGALALHRRGMDETSTIKVQRYLGYGLPVIVGYEETQFAGSDPWYLLRLANTESNVRDSLAQITSFVTAVKGRRVGRAEVGERISAECKEAERLAFLGELAGV